MSPEGPAGAHRCSGGPQGNGRVLGGSWEGSGEPMELPEGTPGIRSLIRFGNLISGMSQVKGKFSLLMIRADDGGR